MGAATGGRRFLYGIVITLMLPVYSEVANARPLAHTNMRSFAYSHYGFHHVGHYWRHFAGGFRYHRYGGLQCVAFVRQETGVQLRDNAAGWWSEAAGLYARGHTPQPGSVLSFRGAGRMRLGHVAVVRQVVNSREIEIDHAHWAGGGVYRNISVIDVSPSNDWTAVRVALRQGANYGSVYPTNGFIYDRPSEPQVEVAAAPNSAPEGRVQMASAIAPDSSASADASALTTEDVPTGEVRIYRKRHWHRWVARRRMYTEVAEAPARHRIKLASHTWR